MTFAFSPGYKKACGIDSEQQHEDFLLLGEREDFSTRPNNAVGRRNVDSTSTIQVMALEIFTKFFMWCSIINIGLLMIWGLGFFCAGDLVYRIQNKVFPVAREQYNTVMYLLLGGFKLSVILFNLVPYIALRLVA